MWTQLLKQEVMGAAPKKYLHTLLYEVVFPAKMM